MGKKKRTGMTVSEALTRLAVWHHSFVSEEAANQAAKALGVQRRAPCHAGRSESDGNPKGLTMNPGQEGSRGIAGWSLAQWICGELNVTYEGKLGRGSQTQACVDALRTHFKTQVV